MKKGASRPGERHRVDSGLQDVNGVAEVPLTDIAVEAFRRQLAISGPGPFLFPSEENPDGIRRRSRRPGAPRCAGRVFRTFGSTI